MSNQDQQLSSILLRDICDKIQYGYTASAKDFEVGPKFLRITDIVPNNINWVNVPFCEISKKEIDKYLLEDGDIVIARTGANTGYAKYIKNPPHSVFASYLVRLKIKDGISKRFVGVIIESDEYKRFIHANIGGAAQPNANAQVLTSFPISLPSYSTQQKIASILSAYDDLIENNLKRIKILEEMAQMIYREWFVKFRFPGHEKVKMVKSELGMIPEGWEVRRLGDIVNTQYGFTETASSQEVGPKFLRGMDINKNSYINWFDVPFCKIEHNDLDKYKLCKGDILVIRMADPGKTGIVEKDVYAVFASYLIRLRIKTKKITPYYLFYFLASEKYQSYIVGASTGTTRKSASASVVTGIDLIIPPSNILKLFEDIISLLRLMINNLLDQNSLLRSTRDLLLPKLINGEIDVEEIDLPTLDNDNSSFAK